MSTDLLERMRALDPATGADLTPPEDLLAQLLSDLPRTAPRRRRRLLLALPATALAAAVVAIAALTGGASPDLAAQAYAQTSDAGDVLYVRTRTASEFGSDRHTTTSESWLYRDRGRLHSTFGKQAWSDLELRPDGSVRFRNAAGQDDVSTDADGPDAQSWHQRLTTNFVAEFRRQYQKGALDPAGMTEFAGRRAQRYVVDGHGGSPAVPGARIPAGTWTLHREFFVDADDATPLGSITVSRSTVPGRPAMTSRVQETVEAIEHLPATPENLAQLELRR
jgi:hypothetical protein